MSRACFPVSRLPKGEVRTAGMATFFITRRLAASSSRSLAARSPLILHRNLRSTSPSPSSAFGALQADQRRRREPEYPTQLHASSRLTAHEVLRAGALTPAEAEFLKSWREWTLVPEESRPPTEDVPAQAAPRGGISQRGGDRRRDRRIWRIWHPGHRRRWHDRRLPKRRAAREPGPTMAQRVGFSSGQGPSGQGPKEEEGAAAWDAAGAAHRAPARLNRRPDRAVRGAPKAARLRL